MNLESLMVGVMCGVSFLLGWADARRKLRREMAIVLEACEADAENEPNTWADPYLNGAMCALEDVRQRMGVRAE